MRAWTLIGARDGEERDPDPESAVAWTRRVEKIVRRYGWHVALAGGNIYTGQSDKDLDLVFFPSDSTCASRRRLVTALKSIGWERTHTVRQMHANWAKKGSKDKKHVEVWKMPDGRRVDAIVMGGT